MEDRDLIAAILRHYPWSGEAVAKGFKPVLSPEEADFRAAIIVEDMAKIGCKWSIRSMPISEDAVLSYYEVPNSDFGKLENENVEECYKASGIGLNWGSLLRLSKVCLIGRNLFPDAWPRRFQTKFLNGKDHFSFIEEMLWISLWRGITNIEYEAKPFARTGSEKSIDWRFDSCGQKINLEVKYRPRDWMRHVDGERFNIVMPSYFDDVPDKFPIRNTGELNLLAVSVPAGIDRSWRERVGILLKEVPALDGVLGWAHSSNDVQPFEIHSPVKGLIETLFTHGDLEDRAHIGYVMHLWRRRDERRAFRAAEVPELLRKLAAKGRIGSEGSIQ